MARDRFVEQPFQDLKIVMKVCRSVTGRENFIGPPNEVGAIMVGDLEDTCGERDIIVETKSKKLETITDIHPKLMSLQYPMLFPNGEYGYHDDIPYVKTANNTGKKRKRITMKEFYSYKLQCRLSKGNYIYKLTALLHIYNTQFFLLASIHFCCYKALNINLCAGNTPRLGGILFQQYIVNSFSAIEQSHLW